MIKGVNRSVIVVKTDKDSRFESAYFVLRPHAREEKGSTSVISEAKQILNAGEVRSNGVTDKKKARRWAFALLCFVLGILAGSGGAWIVYAMFL